VQRTPKLGASIDTPPERHRRRAKKVPAAMLRFPWHVITLRRPVAKDGDDVHRFA